MLSQPGPRIDRTHIPVAEPNVEVRDAIRIACDLEDIVTQVSQCCAYPLGPLERPAPKCQPRSIRCMYYAVYLVVEFLVAS